MIRREEKECPFRERNRGTAGGNNAAEEENAGGPLEIGKYFGIDADWKEQIISGLSRQVKISETNTNLINALQLMIEE